MSSALTPDKATSPRWRKRQDIQILRAVAVLAVVGYHFGLPGFDYGFLGVDVFLVISGYLVGGGLLSELKASSRIDVRRFFTRRIKRLLPASIVVVIATTLLLYGTNALTTRDLRHALWSSLYVQNINLSIEGGDYLSKDMLPTYFVHFWSLSIEEQFYVFVPIILIIIARTKLKQRALFVFTAVGIGSLILSMYQTSAGDPSAYFSLTTRAWQFVLGMVVANIRPSKTYAKVLWIVSIIGLGAFTLLINFDLGLLFPAPGAIIPSLITALALVAGKSIPIKLPIAGFQTAGVFLGDLSYSLYLVHFPISLLVASVTRESEYLLFLIGGLALTLLLAFILKTFVEDPVRFPGFYGQKFKFGVGKVLLANLALALSLILIIQGLSFATYNPAPGTNKPSPTAESPNPTQEPKPTAEYCFGANAMIKDSCEAFILSKPLLPPQSANESISEAYKNGCHIGFSSNPRFKSCTYGATKGFKTTIALVGDSHATQWLPAFDVAGKASGVRVKTFLMSECVFGSVVIPAKCSGFAPWVLKSIAKPGNNFSAIYISNRVSRPEVQAKSAYLKKSFSETLESLKSTNLKIFLIGDTPLGTLDHSDPNLCLMKKQPKDCFGLVDDVKWNNPFAAALEETGVGEYLPVDDLFCIGTKCYKSIGGVPVYRDDDHINVWYSESTIEIWKIRFNELLKRPGA